MHPRAVELIDLLQLQAHPEGGYYRRLYESRECLPSGRLRRPMRTAPEPPSARTPHPRCLR